MKTKTFFVLAALAVSACSLAAAQTPAAPAQRIGTYDSRILAYAHFWSDAFQRRQQELFAAAKAAKESGDKEKFKAAETQLRDQQDRIHLQVFSTAPAEQALAALKDRLPQIQQEANVERLISKWDEPALRQHAQAEKVDVTDLLAREFKPKEKQLKVIQSIKTQKPLSLDKCRALMEKGEL